MRGLRIVWAILGTLNSTCKVSSGYMRILGPMLGAHGLTLLLCGRLSKLWSILDTRQVRCHDVPTTQKEANLLTTNYVDRNSSSKCNFLQAVDAASNCVVRFQTTMTSYELASVALPSTLSLRQRNSRQNSYSTR